MEMERDLLDLFKKQEEITKKFLALDVNEYVEQKNGLSYLSWAFAWREVLKVCPTATYEIHKFYVNDRSQLYFFDPDLGYMVYTSVTINGLTRDMWLPVMDKSNAAMKNVSYEYTTKSGVKTCEPATMFDINKTIMRCLVKNLAMFGIGLYIYAGEDLPEDEIINDKQIAEMRLLEVNEQNVCKNFKCSSIEQLTYKQAEFVIKSKREALEASKADAGKVEQSDN